MHVYDIGEGGKQKDQKAWQDMARHSHASPGLSPGLSGHLHFRWHYDHPLLFGLACLYQESLI